jgi:F-type H+-transporting ATPase subunit b
LAEQPTIIIAQATPEASNVAPHGAETSELVETHAADEGHGGGEHGAFPPFDPSTFPSQLIWLALTFGLLYYLMSKIALPQVGAILEDRDKRISDDLAEAGRLKEETDTAIASYEQALAEARQKAHGIGQSARDEAKAESDRNRAEIEKDLEGRMAEAETRIADVKGRALAEVDTIARETAEAIVEALLGAGAAQQSEIAAAVDAANAERS